MIFMKIGAGRWTNRSRITDTDEQFLEDLPGREHNPMRGSMGAELWTVRGIFPVVADSSFIGSRNTKIWADQMISESMLI